jgi:hypothetical protein
MHSTKYQFDKLLNYHLKSISEYCTCFFNLTGLAPNASLEAFLILPEVTNVGLFFAGAYGMYQNAPPPPPPPPPGGGPHSKAALSLTIYLNIFCMNGYKFSLYIYQWPVL